MSTQVFVLLLAVPPAIALIALWVLVYVVAPRLLRQHGLLLAEAYPNHTTIVAVNFFGRQSDGVGQVRGNGTLLLTPSEIVFELWMPRRRIVIPYTAITELSTPRSFLGKTKGRLLLRVDYVDEAGQSDAVAWLVKDPAALQSAIERARE